jgi:hypothetical protein
LMISTGVRSSVITLLTSSTSQSNMCWSAQKTSNRYSLSAGLIVGGSLLREIRKLIRHHSVLESGIQSGLYSVCRFNRPLVWRVMWGRLFLATHQTGRRMEGGYQGRHLGFVMFRPTNRWTRERGGVKTN